MSRKVLPSRNFDKKNALNRSLVVASLVISMGTFTFANDAKDDRLQKLKKLPREITRITVVFDSSEVAAQTIQFAGDKRFEDAVSDALTSVITDGTDPESALSIASSLCNGEGRQMNECTRNMLVYFMNKPTSFMKLINRTQNDARSRCFFPERGERIDDNWLFCLSLPELSDHLFWAIVPRSRSQAPYNYGFN